MLNNVIFLKKNYYLILLHFFIVALIFEVFLLTRELDNNKKVNLETNVSLLKEGDLMSGNAFSDMDGKIINVDFKNESRKTIIFAYTTTCSFCKKNLPNWNKISSHLNNRFIVLGICFDKMNKVKNFQIDNEINFSTIVPVNDMFTRENNIYAFPATIIVDTKGKVLKAWFGVLEEKTLLEIDSFF